jgi:ABC-2 type transport system permease protein
MRVFLNLYKFELRQNLKSVLIWSAVLAAVLVGFMALFPNFSSPDFQALTEAKIKVIPPSLRSAFGLDSYFDFRNILFFYIYMFQYFVIGIVVFSIITAGTILSKEHEEKHIDYLATKPIKKESLVFSKYLATLSLIVALSLFVSVFGFIIVQIFNKTGNLYFLEQVRLFLRMTAIYIFFSSVAFFASAVARRTINSSMLVIGIFFVSYLFGVMSKILDAVANLKYLSPSFMFETVNATNPFSQTDYFYIAGLLVACFLMVFFAVKRYGSKDLSLQ